MSYNLKMASTYKTEHGLPKGFGQFGPTEGGRDWRRIRPRRENGKVDSPRCTMLDVKGRDVDSFVKEADAKIKEQVKLPTGYYLQWGGAFENQQRAMARLAVIVPLTIGLIFMLLYTAFNSLRHATLIIANVPFAIIGGIVGLFVTGQYLSVPSAIGFIAVFGVAMLNGIVMVTFLNDQRRQGLTIRQAVRRGAELRLRPVLMTASVAILGLVPMLLLPLLYEWSELRAERRARIVTAPEGAQS